MKKLLCYCAIALVGCGTCVVLPPELDAGALEVDAGDGTGGRIGGVAACGTLSLRAAAYGESPACVVACPWVLPSNPSAPPVTCDPAAWEACFSAAWGANGCAELTEVLRDCDPEACR